MTTNLIRTAQAIAGILRCSQSSSADIAAWKNGMIAAVESEARNAAASLRIVKFLRESAEVRAAAADLQSGDSFRVAVGAAQLVARHTGVVIDDEIPYDDDIPF